MTHPASPGHSVASILMRSLSLSLVYLLLIMASACGVQPAVATPTPFFLVTVPADATPTLTPFQPEGVFTPAPAATQLPALVDSIPQPALVAPIAQPAGQVSIILLGSDQRPNSTDFRTDVMMLVTLKTDHSVSLVSFPRDLYVNLPGKGMQRINAAMEFGGFDLLKSTFEYNLGIRPQHYVLTNFSGFQSVVDSLGGIDVNVAKSLQDARTGYPDGYALNPGIVHMDGETALWYVRSRKSTSDFDRLRRAQEVILAISQKLFNLNALKYIPDAYSAYRSAVVTDLTLDDMLQLLPVLQAIDSSRVDRYEINTSQVTPWTDPNSGAAYLLPQADAIRQLLQQAVGVP